MKIWELMKLFYELKGLGWNPLARVATFATCQAAEEFKRIAPDWEVRIRVKREFTL